MSHPNREGRERAVELLYEAEAKGLHPADVVASLPMAPVPYAAALAEGVGDHVELLDQLIGTRARGWTVPRMPAIDRALLRLGSYELAFEPEQPDGVVISEAVALAKRFSTDESPKFVNGVLAAVGEDVRGGGAWRNVSCPLALLVDMDGVVRHWEGGAVMVGDEALGLPAGSFAAAALEPERLRRANDGTLTDEAWREEVAAAMAEAHGCEAAHVLQVWGDDPFRIDEAVVDLIRRVAANGTVTACVSNATTRLESDLEARQIADAFSVVVNSSRVRCLKPDRAIYDAAVEAVAAPAGDCLFVDDRAENVEGALSAGIPAVRFTTPARLEATLLRVGLLP